MGVSIIFDRVASLFGFSCSSYVCIALRGFRWALGIGWLVLQLIPAWRGWVGFACLFYVR